MNELPRGWSSALLKSITSKIGSGATPRGGKDSYHSSGVPLIRSMNIHFDGVKADGLAYLDQDQAAALSNVIVEPNDVLLNITGASIGRVATAPAWTRNARVNQHVAIIRLKDGVEPLFVRAWLASPDIQGIINSENYGVTRQALTKGMIEEFELPLPPFAEQKRIVEKLDSLTAQSREATTALGRVESLTTRYKAAVLVRAFSGRLTEDLRDNSVSGEFSEMLGVLPGGWKQATLGDIADIQTGLQVGKRRSPEEKLQQYPYLRVANVQRGWLDLTEIKYLGATEAEFRKLVLQPGDILMNEGGDRDKLGRGWVWKNEISNCIHQNHVYRVRLKTDQVSPEYVSMFTNEFGRNYFFDQGQQTTNLASISKTRLSGVPVPIPPRAEAFEIVARIESAFTQIETLTRAVTAARTRLQSLDRAVLAKAFRGELVHQDPNDEPASELLKRVKETTS